MRIDVRLRRPLSLRREDVVIVEVHGSAGRTTPKLVLHRSSWCPLVLRYNAILHVDPSKMDVAPAENCTHCFRDRAAGG